MRMVIILPFSCAVTVVLVVSAPGYVSLNAFTVDVHIYRTCLCEFD